MCMIGIYKNTNRKSRYAVRAFKLNKYDWRFTGTYKDHEYYKDNIIYTYEDVNVYSECGYHAFNKVSKLIKKFNDMQLFAIVRQHNTTAVYTLGSRSKEMEIVKLYVDSNKLNRRSMNIILTWCKKQNVSCEVHHDLQELRNSMELQLKAYRSK